MNIYAVMTTKNEADKHLRSVLNRLLPAVDGVFVYDDRSSDNTQGLARGLGAEVVVRHVDTPTFMDDESAFRTASYHAFEKHMKPRDGDWVLSIDADEMLVEDYSLRDMALATHATAYALHKAEVWDVSPINNTPYIRTDGFWGDLYTPRFFRWSDALPVHVPDGIMGCGSIPEWAFRSATKTKWVSLLHYGYATQEDRVRKYARYFGTPGHNPTHINSILKHPTLTQWEGSHL